MGSATMGSRTTGSSTTGSSTTGDEQLSLHWVEVRDERGRTRLEMRWSVVATEPALPVEQAEVVPAAPAPPPVTPAA